MTTPHLDPRSALQDAARLARGPRVPVTLRRLLERHSIGPRWMTAPGPTLAQLRLATRAALRAPDHGRLVPWRAVVVPDGGREVLADLFARFARDAGKTDEDVAIERERAFNGPALVAWVVRIDDDVPEVPAHEQWMCAGGALANFLNALHLMGFGAKTLSGRKCRHPALTQAFCREREQLVAFVCIGTPTRKPTPRVVDDADEVLSLWRGPRL
ncbi:nitroreductase [Calidifontimicrobium sp. SYSU G02091]|uniref:nitroreductase family protein n=1 Tax=Azohydromonas TaxID=312063 RepID=UPI001F26AAEE|nr:MULTISPECIES: nitroreductase [Azohydromonas]MCI1193501.1 nitroreductase [Calidifontimicrobium sp. SYSU G02091]